MLDIEMLKANGVNVWGYVRVSTKDQKLDRQLDAMQAYGVPESHIWEDKETGKTFNRPEYKKMIRVAQRGDIIVIKSIDRLGRNYTEIQDQWKLITQDIGCGIHVLDMPALNTTGDPGDLISRFVTDMILQVLAFVAQNERENTLKRQKEGLKAMRKRVGSMHVGRPKLKIPFEFWELFILWKSGELKTKEITKLCEEQYGMSTRTFYRRMRELDSRYGDIPPDKLRDYIVEDDFADGINFVMERIDEIVGNPNTYIPNIYTKNKKKESRYLEDTELEGTTKKEQAMIAEEEEIKRIVLEKRRAEFRKHFGIDSIEPRYKKHGKKKSPTTRRIREAIKDAEYTAALSNIKTIIVD